MEDIPAIRPGSGVSPPNLSGVYTDTHTIEILIALMDAPGSERMSFIGNAIGGRIAWTLAAHHPERVDRRVRVSPEGFASPGTGYGEPPGVSKTSTLMRYFLPESMVRSNPALGYCDPARLALDTVNRYYDLLWAAGARCAACPQATDRTG